jgi:hypothetical protein
LARLGINDIEDATDPQLEEIASTLGITLQS